MIKFGKVTIQRALRSFGFQLVRCKPDQQEHHDTLLTLFLKTTKNAGFSPHLIYDVGANRGTWTKEVRTVFPNSAFKLFEPQIHLQDHLNELAAIWKNTEVRPYALSSTSGSAQFSASSWDVTSRLAPVGINHQDTSRSELYNVRVTTVDEEVAKDSLPLDLLKIDVEGEELNVIEGARASLNNVGIVIIECGICSQSITNTALKIMNIMDEKGFDLMGIVNLNPFQTSDGNYASGLIWLADLAFVNRRSVLSKSLSDRPGSCLDSIF